MKPWIIAALSTLAVLTLVGGFMAGFIYMAVTEPFVTAWLITGCVGVIVAFFLVYAIGALFMNFYKKVNK